MNELTLSISHISKTYDRPVLDDVSFDIKSGKIYGLLGPNGAGKSTLFKIICGLTKADQGEVLVNGEPLKKGSFGYMIEGPSFDEDLSGYENLYALSILFDGVTKEQINRALSAVGIESKKGYPVKQYSLGMKQRLYFAYAIMCSPRILFLDEPFNGLDPISVRDLELFLRDYAKTGAIILVSSHMIDEIEHLCQGLVIMDQGKVTYQHENISEIDLREAFFSHVSSTGEAQ